MNARLLSLFSFFGIIHLNHLLPSTNGQFAPSLTNDYNNYFQQPPQYDPYYGSEQQSHYFPTQQNHAVRPAVVQHPPVRRSPPAAAALKLHPKIATIQKARLNNNDAHTPVVVSAGTTKNAEQKMEDWLFEGDMIIADPHKKRNKTGDDDDEENGMFFAAVRNERERWSSRNIPFQFDSNLSPDKRQKVLSVMQSFRTQTCVNFVPRTNEPNYVLISGARGTCSSTVGFMDRSQQQMTVLLADECFPQIGRVEHELMHVLGFYHEQSRADRDSYVSINLNLVERSAVQNFRKYSTVEVDHLGYAYDYGSLMHYPTNAFSINGQETITLLRPLPPGVEVGQRSHFSQTDLNKIRALFQCSAQCGATDFKCATGSTCIAGYKKCDRRTDCPDGSDESPSQCRISCTSRQFSCGEKCIDSQWVCDGNHDCQNGADEDARNCPAKCPSGSYRCQGSSSTCIPSWRKCNGQRDCPNGDDEQNCAQPSSFTPLAPQRTTNNWWNFNRPSSPQPQRFVAASSRRTTSWPSTSRWPSTSSSWPSFNTPASSPSTQKYFQQPIQSRYTPSNSYDPCTNPQYYRSNYNYCFSNYRARRNYNNSPYFNDPSIMQLGFDPIAAGVNFACGIPTAVIGHPLVNLDLDTILNETLCHNLIFHNALVALASNQKAGGQPILTINITLPRDVEKFVIATRQRISALQAATNGTRRKAELYMGVGGRTSSAQRTLADLVRLGPQATELFANATRQYARLLGFDGVVLDWSGVVEQSTSLVAGESAKVALNTLLVLTKQLERAFRLDPLKGPNNPTLIDLLLGVVINKRLVVDTKSSGRDTKSFESHKQMMRSLVASVDFVMYVNNPEEKFEIVEPVNKFFVDTIRNEVGGGLNPSETSKFFLELNLGGQQYVLPRNKSNEMGKFEGAALGPALMGEISPFPGQLSAGEVCERITTSAKARAYRSETRDFPSSTPTKRQLHAAALLPVKETVAVRPGKDLISFDTQCTLALKLKAFREAYPATPPSTLQRYAGVYVPDISLDDNNANCGNNKEHQIFPLLRLVSRLDRSLDDALENCAKTKDYSWSTTTLIE